MGKKLYKINNCGGYEIIDKTSQQPFVMIENYIIDLWMPVIGVDALGLYTAYKRAIFKGNKVIRRSQAELGKLLRIGKSKLSKLNNLLEECGFIRVTKPTGKEKLEHKPTKIEVFDPPKELSSELVNKYCDKKYSTFFEWFVEPYSETKLPEIQNGTSEIPESDSGNEKNQLSEKSETELQKTQNKNSEYRSSVSQMEQNNTSDSFRNNFVYNKENINKNIINKNNNSKDVDELDKLKLNTPFEFVSRETLETLVQEHSKDEIIRTMEILSPKYSNGLNIIKSPTALLRSCLKKGVKVDIPYIPVKSYINNSTQNLEPEKLNNNLGFNEKIDQFVDKNRNYNVNHEEEWMFIIEKLKKILNSRSYKFWIKSLKFLCVNHGRILVLTPNRFSAKWLRENYQDKFMEIVQEYELDVSRILFIPLSKE